MPRTILLKREKISGMVTRRGRKEVSYLVYSPLGSKRVDTPPFLAHSRGKGRCLSGLAIAEVVFSQPVYGPSYQADFL